MKANINNHKAKTHKRNSEKRGTLFIIYARVERITCLHIIKMEGAVKSYEPNLCPREARQFIQIGRYGISIYLPNDNVKIQSLH